MIAMRRAGAALLVGLLALHTDARAEWVLTLYTGASHTYASTVHVTQPATGSDASFEGVPWAPHPFALGAPYYGVRVSYFPSRRAHVGATLDFTHYKMYAETAQPVKAAGVWNGVPFRAYAPLDRYVQDFQISHGVNLASLAVQYRWNPQFDRGPWEKHVGVGLLAYLPHSKGTIDGLAVNGDYGYAGWGGQIFGGVEYALPRRWTPRGPLVALLIESKLDMGSLDLELDPLTRVHTRVATLHLLGGIALHFE
jgi:hypothetical protein